MTDKTGRRSKNTKSTISKAMLLAIGVSLLAPNAPTFAIPVTPITPVTPINPNTLTEDTALENTLQSYLLQIEELEMKIQDYDSKVIEAMEKVSTLSRKVVDSEKRVSKLRQDVVEAEKQYEKILELTKDRLVAVQLDNTSSASRIAEVLFSSEGFSDLLHRAYAVSKLMDASVSLTEELEAKEKELKRKKKKLDAELRILKENKDKAVIEENEIKLAKEKVTEELAKVQELKQNEEVRLAQERERLAIELELSLSNSSFTRGINAPSLATVDVSDVNSEKARTVILEAYEYLGVPYVWGGTTPSGFDCSGLMQYIYKEVGVYLPRVARAQQNYGIIIPLTQIQPGDMVFREYPATHVGIYIGDGKVLHAPQTGDVVKIATYRESWWTSATRVLY